MAIDEQQKDILRKRLELARASKVAKKQKIADIVQAPKIEDQPKVEEVEPIKKPQEPKIVNDISLAKVKEIPFEEPLPSKPLYEKSPKAKPKKETKEKYAKLVFYKEPSGKTASRLSRIMNDEDSDHEQQPSQAKPPQTPRIAPQQPPMLSIPKPDPRLVRQQQISNMAKRFFDGN